MEETHINPSGPESEGLAYLQGQVLALSAILSRPGLRQWSDENVLKKARSPYEEDGQFDRCFKRGLSDTLDFVTGL